jgi:hypothetical protein
LSARSDRRRREEKEEEREAQSEGDARQLRQNLPVLSASDAVPRAKEEAQADQACLNCHSTDIVRQQRLNEKQWTANVTKMVGWGAEVPESGREALIAYLVANFGPDNDRFEPVVTRPVGR